MKESRKLRVGVLLDDTEVTAWAFRMLERIHDSSYAEISLLVINEKPPPVPRKSFWAKLRDSRGQIVSRVVRKGLNKVQSHLIDRVACEPDAFEVKNLRDLLPDVTAIHVKPTRKKVSDFFSDPDVDKLEGENLDVLIRIGFRILRGRILKAAKFGVWSLHHGDNLVNRGGPPGFWEVMESWPETGSILQILTEDLDNGKVLFRSASGTFDRSVQYNKNGFYWKSLSFIPRKLEELHRLGEELFFRRVEAENSDPNFYSNRLFVRPTNSEYARVLFRKLKQKLHTSISHRFFFDQWILQFGLGDEIVGAMWRHRRIVPPKDRFWADPHVLIRDGTYYIFIEELLYSTNKGHISVLEMDGKGNYSEPVPVLEKPYHLSYPFVFESDGETYMIPESASERAVGLYRCRQFPGEWEFVMNLMEDVSAVDATLYFHDEKWWMFVNIRENSGASSCDELFLFYADDFKTSEWTAHPLNPIVSSATTARPAGGLFVMNGKLYRPSQNCSVRYGYGFNINEVLELSATAYSENTVTAVEPNWDKDVLATHTFSRAGRLTVADAQIRRRR